MNVVLQILAAIHEIGSMVIKLHQSGADKIILHELRDIIAEVHTTVSEHHDREFGDTA